MDAQGSEGWIKIRLGRCTASRVADALATISGGKWGASRANYCSELVVERLTGVPTEHYQSPAMIYGSQLEPEARNFYAYKYDADVAETGFWPHPSIVMAGGSPDGLVGTHGIVEIKCPERAAHKDALLNDTIRDRYLKQIQFLLACTDREWCDFISYDCRYPVHMRLFVKRIFRVPEKIKELEQGVRGFLAEVDRDMERLRERYSERAAA